MFSSMPFASAHTNYAQWADELHGLSQAATQTPPTFQGRAASFFAEVQAARRVELTKMADAATEVSAASATQNEADEKLAAAPTPRELEVARAAVEAARTQMRAGNIAPAQIAAAEQEYADMKSRREAALAEHAGECAATGGCFGGLDLPGGAQPQPRGGEGEELGTESGIDKGGSGAGDVQRKTDPSAEAPSAPPDLGGGDVPPDDVVSPGSASSVPPPGGSGIGGGGAAGTAPLDPMGPMSLMTPAEAAGTGLSVGGAPMMPQQPAMQPMMQQPPGGGMPGMGGMPPMPAFGMPGGAPATTAPSTGRMLDPNLGRRAPESDSSRDSDSSTTTSDLDSYFDSLDLSPVAGGAAVAAGVGVGASIAGAVTQANVTGVTAPVVSAGSPMIPGGGSPGVGAGGAPYGGGMAPMAPMGSGAGAAGAGTGMKRDPILAADGGAVGQENLREAVDSGTIGRATSEPPTSDNR